MISCVLFDLDGTVYRGTDAIPGAADFVNELKRRGVQYLFVTNRANRTPAVVAAQLESMGIPCDPSEVLTSSQATAQHLKTGKLFYIGEDGMDQALEGSDISITDEDPDYVVISFDPEVTLKKIEKAVRLIRAGARFLATNPDPIITTESGISPENGAIVAAVAACVDVEPEFIGKPEPIIINIAMEMLNANPAETIIVGDNLYTDIEAGHKAGIRSALILTGVSTREDADKCPFDPTWIVKDYDELTEVVFSAPNRG